jgi:hypothetical protein
MITTGTYVGYVIILAGIFIGLFTGTPISSRLVSFRFSGKIFKNHSFVFDD